MFIDIWKKGKEWRRVEVAPLSTLLNDNYADDVVDCFASVQVFNSAKEAKGEAHIAPLYFDLDSDGDVELAWSETKMIYKYLKSLQVADHSIKVYFSGNKGFHIILNTKVLGLKPDVYTTKNYKELVKNITQLLGLSTVDLGVYTDRRMLRLPNSINGKSGLYKVRITDFSMGLNDILEYAKTAQQDSPFIGDSKRSAILLDAYKKAIISRQAKKPVTVSVDYDLSLQNPPVCVQDVLNNGWQEDDGRNTATVQLALFYKQAGETVEMATRLITGWMLKFTSAKSKMALAQRKSNTASVVESTYDSDMTFSCAGIRSVGSNSHKIACSGKNCKSVKTKPKASQDHTLNSLSKPQNFRKQITTVVMVVGKRSNAFMVPYKLNCRCTGASSCKVDSCSMLNSGETELQHTLSLESDVLIDLCNTPKQKLINILRSAVGIPKKCPSFVIDVVEVININEIMVIPKVGEIEHSEEYTLKLIYSAGDVDVEENRYYSISGVVHPHPKDQTDTMLITKAEPLEDSLDSFVVTDDIERELCSVFQPADDSVESINTKLDEVLDDISCNVTGIYRRNDVLLGILLVYHSALSLKLAWEDKPTRGWLETIIIGDTGTGKSHMVEKIQNYCGLGSEVNAEVSSRTGISYKLEQAASGHWIITFGAWPRADRSLLWIDEASAIDKSQYGLMTLARSSGRLAVKRAVTSETPCRVRLIATGNAAEGKTLSDYTRGVESLVHLFNAEDIRRFDFGLFMRSEDISSDVYNMFKAKEEPFVGSEALKSNIMYAWSRSTDDITIDNKAVQAIIKASNELSSKFGSATAIPLVSVSDQKNKISRMSVALALLLHSVKDNKVFVLPQHVEIIKDYLVRIYSTKTCGLNRFANAKPKDTVLQPGMYDVALKYIIEAVKPMNSKDIRRSTLDYFTDKHYVKVRDTYDMLPLQPEEVKDLLQVFVKLKFLEISSFGYKKTNRFNWFLNLASEKNDTDNLDLLLQ